MKLTINIFNRRFSVINIIVFIASFFLVLAVFSNFSPNTLNAFFSSDALYLPSIYKDLFVDGNSLKGWHLNPSPNFFPDMIVYFILTFVSGNNFIISSFLFAVFQYLILLYVSSRIFKEVLPGASIHWYSVIYLLLSVFLLEHFYFTKDQAYSFYLIINSYHTGSFIMSLFAFLITIKYYKKPSNNLLIILFVFGVLCVVSDRLFIVMYAMPAIISSFLLLKKERFIVSIKFIIVNILLVFVGIKIFDLLSKSEYVFIDNPHKIMDFESIKSSFDIYTEQMTIYISEIGFKSLSIYLFLLSFAALIFMIFYIRKDGNWLTKFFVIYSIFFGVIVISAPIINGNYSGYDTLRYNVYPFYFASLSLTFVLAHLIKNTTLLKAGKLTTIVLGFCLLIVSLTNISSNGLDTYFNYYPETAKNIDGIAEKEGLLCGVGNYWEAKKTTLFSKKGVKIYAVYEDLAAYEHVANQNWFFAKNEFNFVLLNNFQDTTLYYKKNQLTHTLISNKPDFLLVKTNTFIYEKDKGYLPVNSLRSK